MMSVSLKIAVAESSQIIRSGLLACEIATGLNVSVVEIAASRTTGQVALLAECPTS